MNIDIAIDSLTPCLIERATGEVLTTEMVSVKLKNKEYAGWNFDWSLPYKTGYEVYALKIVGTDQIQGLIAWTIDFENKAVHVDIAETAPHNFGSMGKYEGVGSHLFAFACYKALQAGYDYIYFDAKTNLIEYYKERLGALQIGDTQRMLIEGEGFNNLIEAYYGGDK